MKSFRRFAILGGQRQLASRFAAIRCLLIAFAVVLVSGFVFQGLDDGSSSLIVIGDLTQLVLSGCATVTTLTAGFRSTGRLRTSWLWIGVGTGGWFGGQLIWCYYEFFVTAPTPFPSVADISYLIFPVAVTIGLWHFPGQPSAGIRLRKLLDGLVVVGSLVAISWSLVLDTTVRESHGLPVLVSIAYPIGDVLVLSVLIYGLSRPGPYRRTQLWLALSMTGMAVSDCASTYLTAVDKYQTGSLFDLGWVTCFTMMSAAAHLGADTDSAAPAPARRGAIAPSMLPYLPLTVAAAVIGVEYFLGLNVSAVEVGSMAIAIVAVLGRQYIALRDNRILVAVIEAREEQLREQATMDLLTGLANRALFSDRVAHALELHRRDMRPLALLFCDLDDFKAVNDTYGHPAGDELLVRVSDRLRGALRSGDTLARFGGDEFAILVEDGADAAQIGARIIDALQAPFTIGGSQLTIRVSVGVIEVAPGEPSPPLDTLLTHADSAMYSAKRSGKGKLALYEPHMTPANVLDLPLQMPLAAAVAAGSISVVYQPVVAFADGRTVGLESLARWEHEGKQIPPSQFVPLATRSGLIGPLTALMLERACGDLAVWSRRLQHHELKVAVNVSPSLIADPAFPAQIADLIDRHQLAPDQLVLELTEDALIGDIETTREVTRELREMGIALALDDFGTGYSSLVHLQKVPLKILKIDMSFVANIDREVGAERLIRALVGLGRDLGLDIVAEGVERPQQAELLRSMGCPFGQGYFFAKAAPAGIIEDLLIRESAQQQSALS